MIRCGTRSGVRKFQRSHPQDSESALEHFRLRCGIRVGVPKFKHSHPQVLNFLESDAVGSRSSRLRRVLQGRKKRIIVFVFVRP